MATAGTALPQLAGDQRAKFQDPAPDHFVGEVKAALSKQLLDIAIAKREPKIEPDRVLNQGRREAMAAVREQRHAPTIRLSAVPTSVCVTMPSSAPCLGGRWVGSARRAAVPPGTAHLHW